MLFSDKKVADFISENFEPVWQSLRPVPKVSIDFGDGKVVNRTLHGNIASFVCSADGDVIDILPGVYDRENYLEELRKLQKLAAKLPVDAESRNEVVHEYHQKMAAQTRVPVGPITNRDSLEADARLNEQRRIQIHYKLALAATKPGDIEKWLYKQVLHADLDDPYLGLQRTLFATYPFDDSLPTQTP